MPGVELKDGKILIMGKEVKRAYVNDKEIFGDDESSIDALSVLEASSVAYIEAYEETDKDSAIALGEENAEKNMTLNVATFEDFNVNIAGNFSAEGGVDLQKDIDGKIKYRYALSGNTRYDSENTHLYGNVSIENLPTFDPGTDRYIRTRFSAHHETDSLNGFNVNFDYSNNRLRSRSRTSEDFYPTDEFAERSGSSYSSNISGRQNISLGGGYSYSSYKTSVRPDVELSYGTSYNRNSSNSAIVQDAVSNSHARNLSDKGKSYRIAPKIDFRHRFNDGNTLDIRTAATFGRNFSDGMERDTMDNSGLTNIKTYTLDTDNRNVDAYAYLGYNINTHKSGSFGFATGYVYENTKQYRFKVDEVTGMIDSLQSQKDTDNSSALFLHGFYNLNTEKLSLLFSIRYDLKRVITREQLYGRTYRPRVYGIISPFWLSFEYNPNPSIQLNCDVNIARSAPSTRQIVDLLDTSDPMNLFVGNPGLKPSESYDSQWGFSYMKGNGTLSVNLTAGLYNNNIMNSYRYFTASETLTDYGGYNAAAGAVLLTPVNMGVSYRLAPNISYANNLNFMKSKGSIGVSYSRDNPQTMTLDRIVRTVRQDWGLSASLSSNFSSKFRARVSSSSTWRRSRYVDFKQDDFHQNFSASIRWDFLNRMQFESSYSANWYIRGSQAYGNETQHILNMSLACKVFANRKGTIFVNAFNILNRDRGYSTTVGERSVTQTWNMINPSYITIGFKYDLIKQK